MSLDVFLRDRKEEIRISTSRARSCRRIVRSAQFNCILGLRGNDYIRYTKFLLTHNSIRVRDKVIACDILHQQLQIESGSFEHNRHRWFHDQSAEQIEKRARNGAQEARFQELCEQHARQSKIRKAAKIDAATQWSPLNMNAGGNNVLKVVALLTACTRAATPFMYRFVMRNDLRSQVAVNPSNTTGANATAAYVDVSLDSHRICDNFQLGTHLQ